MREIVGHHDRRHHTAPSGPTTGPEQGLGGLGFGVGRCGRVAASPPPFGPRTPRPPRHQRPGAGRRARRRPPAVLAQGDVLRTPGAMCYKTPGLLTASVVWPGAWRGPIGIKPGRIYPRSPPDQPSDWPATKDCSALVPNLSTTLQALCILSQISSLGCRAAFLSWLVRKGGGIG
jgi:hypothetical protein